MSKQLANLDILVTGGAGFIGSSLIQTLVPQNNVTVLDDCSTGDSDRLPSEVEFIQGDVQNQETVSNATLDTDVIFHLAGLVDVAQSIENPHKSHSINTVGTLNILAAAKEQDAKVVLASSAAVYGSPDYTPLDENHKLHPISPYGLDKLTADHYTQLYHDLYNLETVVLRYFNVYGPRQQGSSYAGVISIFIEQALNNEPITIHGDGEQTRDFVYVDDIIQANILAAKTNNIGKAYNIGTGESVTIRELAEVIVDITDSHSDIVHMDPRSGDIHRSLADISSASEELKYNPSISLCDGIEQTVNWFRE